MSKKNNLGKYKQEIIKFTSLVSFSGIIGTLLNIPASIITAKFLGPSLYGVLAIIRVVKHYSGYSHLGLLNSLPREVPIAYGKGNTKEAKEITHTVFSGFVIAVNFGLIILWILFLFTNVFNQILDFFLMVLLSLAVITSESISFLRNYLKAEGYFIHLGKADFLLKVLIPITSIPAVVLFKVEGILISLFISEMSVIIFIIIQGKLPRFNFCLNAKKTLDLLRVGFILFLSKIAAANLLSVGLILLAIFMTSKEVGVFSIALSVLMVKKIPFSQAVNTAIYRKIMLDGGKFGIENKKYFFKYQEKVLGIYILINILIIGGMLQGYAFAIKTILNEYLQSIHLMFILFFGFIVFISRDFLTYYLNITNQLKKLLLINFSGLFLNIILFLIFFRFGLGLESVAYSCMFSFIFISSAIFIISLQQIYKNYYKVITFFVKVLMIATVSTLTMVILNNFYIFDYLSMASIYNKFFWGISDLILKYLIYFTSCFAIIFLFFHKYNIWDEIMAIIRYLLALLKRITKFPRFSRHTEDFDIE